MKNKKVFYWLFLVVILLIALGLWYRQTVDQTVLPDIKQTQDNIKVSVSLDDGVNSAIYPMTLKQNSTVLQALQSIKNLSINLKDYGSLGKMIIKIGDKTNGENGKYWQYWLNKNYATLGADKQVLRTGDFIEWKFTQH